MWKKMLLSCVAVSCFWGSYAEPIAAEPVQAEVNDQVEIVGEVFNGHRYAVIDEGMTWHEAEQYCKRRNGHLAYIKSEDVQKFLEELLMLTGTKNSYWIGGEQSSLRGDKWSWLDGTPIEGYTNWAKGQPDNIRETKLMLYRNINLANKETKLGEWNDLAPEGVYKDEVFFGVHNFGLICEWDHP